MLSNPCKNFFAILQPQIPTVSCTFQPSANQQIYVPKYDLPKFINILTKKIRQMLSFKLTYLKNGQLEKAEKIAGKMTFEWPNLTLSDWRPESTDVT